MNFTIRREDNGNYLINTQVIKKIVEKYINGKSEIECCSKIIRVIKEVIEDGRKILIVEVSDAN